MAAILFVCTANLCRSPIAERLFAQIISRAEPNKVWDVQSAGVWAVAGIASPGRLVKAAARSNLDLRPHRSQSVEQVNLAANDLILTMEAGQCEALRAEFPDLATRIHQLSALAGPRYDIADPYGGSEQEYLYMIDELNQLLHKALPRIVELAKRVHEETTQTVALATKPAVGVDDSGLGHDARADGTHRPISEHCLSSG